MRVSVLKLMVEEQIDEDMFMRKWIKISEVKSMIFDIPFIYFNIYYKPRKIGIWLNKWYTVKENQCQMLTIQIGIFLYDLNWSVKIENEETINSL